jgi:hypothetical protein
MAFGAALMPSRFNKRHPFVQPGNRYYVSVGVIRSKSITVSAEDESSNDVSVDLEVLASQASVDGKFHLRHESNGEITFEGSSPLAFGVELLEMVYDSDERKFVLSALRGPESIRDDQKPPERVYIGDPERGNVFIDLTNQS